MIRESRFCSEEPLPKRAGAVQAAVVRVLLEADVPLRASEIQARAERFLGEPASWNTVKDCLHKNARRLGGTIERVAHGTYRAAIN